MSSILVMLILHPLVFTNHIQLYNYRNSKHTQKEITDLSFSFSRAQHLIIFTDGNQKQNWSDSFKTVYPFSPLWPLSPDIHHPTIGNDHKLKHYHCILYSWMTWTISSLVCIIHKMEKALYSQNKSTMTIFALKQFFSLQIKAFDKKLYNIYQLSTLWCPLKWIIFEIYS